MKVVRNPSVWAALSRVFSSAAGRASIDYISLTHLEWDDLLNEYGVDFSWDGTGNCVGVMCLDSWGRPGEIVAVRIEAQDKHSRARRIVKGNGSERTR